MQTNWDNLAEMMVLIAAMGCCLALVITNHDPHGAAMDMFLSLLGVNFLRGARGILSPGRASDLALTSQSGNVVSPSANADKKG